MLKKTYSYCFNEKKNLYYLKKKKKCRALYFFLRKIRTEVKIFSSISLKYRFFMKKAFKKKRYETLINRPEFIFMYVDRIDYLNEDMYLDVYLHTFIDHHYLKHEIYTMDFVEENYTIPKLLSNQFNKHFKKWLKYSDKIKNIPEDYWITKHSWKNEWNTKFMDPRIQKSMRKLYIKKIKKAKLLKKLIKIRYR